MEYIDDMENFERYLASYGSTITTIGPSVSDPKVIIVRIWIPEYIEFPSIRGEFSTRYAFDVLLEGITEYLHQQAYSKKYIYSVHLLPVIGETFKYSNIPQRI